MMQIKFNICELKQQQKSFKPTILLRNPHIYESTFKSSWGHTELIMAVACKDQREGNEPGIGDSKGF